MNVLEDFKGSIKKDSRRRFRKSLIENGCPGRIRTYDQVINSHLLYH